MSNGHVCCIVGLCCPPASAEQRQATIEEFQKARPKMSAKKVEALADRFLKEHNYFKTTSAMVDAA